ncbi:MAG: RnfABCDGE type electron transport complex subunit D, partial [Candidatus Pacebacteria bacterium]|nr:RnfABCDGE type electron transport complex subunit D [Candidatus Paceibacterota bacterium]
MPENNEIKNIKVIKGAPFLKAKDTVPRIMWDVSLALLPAILASVYFFGLSAAFVILNAIISCVIFDFICLKARNNKKINYGSSFDGSAVVTGILLSFNLPSTVPWWLVTISSAVAIIITKHFFGGLGRNIFNPALAGRIFAMHAWPDFMSASWIPPRTVWNSAGINLPWTSIDNSAVLKAFNTYATPLHDMKEGLASKLPSLTNMFLGNIGGCLGETSAAALLLGAIYLLIRKRITLIIPLTYIGTVGLLTWVFA